MVDIAPPKGRIITPLADVYDGPAIRLSSLVVNRSGDADLKNANILPQRRISEVERLNRLNHELGNVINCHRLSKNLTPIQKQMKKQFFSNNKEMFSARKNRLTYRTAVHNNGMNYSSSVYSEKFKTGKRS